MYSSINQSIHTTYVNENINYVVKSIGYAVMCGFPLNCKNNHLKSRKLQINIY